MKKIILICSVLFCGYHSFSQSPLMPAKQMSVQEANKLNGTVMPTINGIAYDQYRAGQIAKQNAVAPSKNTTGKLTASSDDQVAGNAVTPVQLEKPAVTVLPAKNAVATKPTVKPGLQLTPINPGAVQKTNKTSVNK
ncbi:MAG: hypothetical protein H0W12_05205 [Chitinophagaceae bacterium]|nr:hypothetical protein [Chitinophagaceae bacterium]